MLPGDLTPDDAGEWTSTVLVNGVEREASSWTAKRRLTGDLPEQVAAVGSVTQATGTIEWAPSEDVAELPVNPFNASTGWVPSEGDRVQIYVSDGETSFPRFTGRIDQLSGSVGEGFSATLIDDYDALGVPYTHTAVSHRMPPRTEGFPLRQCGMSPMHIVVDAARTAGYTNVWGPPSESHAVVAMGQGSIWPRVGELVEADNYANDPGAVPLNRREPWGWSVNDFRARYDTAQTIGGETSVQINMSVGLQHVGSAHVILEYSSGDSIRLQINEVGGVRTAILRRNGVDITSVTMGADDLSIAARYVPPSGGDATYMLETETASASGNAAGVSGVIDDVWWRCFAGGSVAGLFVSRVDSAFPLLSDSFAPNLKIDVSFQFMTSYTPVRHIIDSTVRKTLEEIAKALLLAVFFDESGNLIVKSSDLIGTGEPVLTLDTLDDIVSLGWKRDTLSVRERVRVKYMTAAASTSRYPTLKAFIGSADRLELDDVLEEFYDTPAELDFIQVATPVQASDAQESAINDRRGSWVGASYTTDTVDSEWTVNSVTFDWSEVNGRVWKLVTERVGGPTPGAEITTETVSEGSGTSLAKWLQGEPLPQIRCMGRLRWADGMTNWVTTGSTFGGPLEHETGPWAGTAPASAVHGNIRDRIAAFVANPLPQITGLEIIPDPRIQLTDLHQIESTTYMGAIITGMCVGVSESFDGAYSMSLAERVTESSETFQTLKAWDAAGPDGQTLAEFNDEGDQTLTEFNIDMEA